MTKADDGSVFDRDCRACPRLAAFLDDVKAKYPDYYCRPVPPFGDAGARLLVVGPRPPGEHRRQHRDQRIDHVPHRERQGQGLGSALVYGCERRARELGFARVGISVSQAPGLAGVERLYRRLGFKPDGQGVTPHDNELHLVKPPA